MVRTAIQRVLGAACAILLAAAAARAQSVHEVVAGGDAISGTITAGGEVDRVPIRLVDGGLLAISLKAAKGSTLLPTLTILGPDRQPDGSVAAFLKANSKGNALSVKNLPVSGTGLRWIEIRAQGTTTGGWLLTTKIKYPKGAAGTPSIDKAVGPTSFPFTVPGNATSTIVVAADKGSAANPVFGALVDPAAANLIVDEVVPGKTGFSIKNVLLGKPGVYTLVLQPGTGGNGGVKVSIKWKIPKPFKRALLETQVITDPVLTAIGPTSGNNSQIVAVNVTVDFARPGVKVSFRKPPTVVTAQGSGLTVGPTSITFNQSLLSFQKGEYDVEVENADGGKDTLPLAFSVANAPATLSGISPNSGSDNESVQATVTGMYINGGASVSLVRGLESIPGTGVLATSNSITATFDLRGHAIGLFDVVVINPDAAATSLDDAFEILNAPPVVTALSPSNNLDASVVSCTIDGSDFDPTPTTLLRKTGQADIPGTSVVRISGSQLSCSFDTTGRAIGAWNLVVTNPDLRSGTLANAFQVSGPVAPAAQSFATTNNADAPPSICWNGARNEFAVAWIDVNGGNYDVRVQRLDPAGTPLGTAVSVSSAATSVPKRDAVVAWDSTNDQYLVCWSQIISISVAFPHPSTGYTSVYSVYAQRLQGSDASSLGANVQVTDHVLFSGFNMDEFNNIRPDACWDPFAGLWQIIWTQEWSTQNVNAYGTDDWDVIRRSLSPASVLGTAFIGVATTQYHEGDASIVYNPVSKGVVAAWSFRGTPTSALTGVLGSAGNTVSSDSNDTQDLRLAVDPDGNRLLVTWTKSPLSAAKKYVEGATYDLGAISTKVGATVSSGSGTDDHFLARPVYNTSLKQALVTWTRKDTSGGLTVRSRRATTGTSSGLVLVGSELTTSSGSTDEAMPAVAFSATAGESVVLWLKTLTFVSVNSYAGSTLPGIYRGKEFWLIRYR